MDMQYEKIWSKVLSPNETVQLEFSLGDRYRNFVMVVWLIISLPFLFAGIGVLMIIAVLFYYAFYAKVANAYALTNKRILIHTGWLSTKLVSVDYTKITDIHVREPFFDRILTKSGHLVVNTAGSSASEIILKHIQTPYEIRKKIDQIKDNDIPLPSQVL